MRNTFGWWIGVGAGVAGVCALLLCAMQYPGWVLMGGLGICAVFWHKGEKYEKENREVDDITRETVRILEEQRGRRRGRGRAPDGKPWN